MARASWRGVEKPPGDWTRGQSLGGGRETLGDVEETRLSTVFLLRAERRM
jgi:hypothetical protein